MVKRRARAYGSCKLCQQRKRLLLSHLIPKAVYALCRAAGAPNPNPFLVTQEFVMQTSRQVRDHLLCFDCEQLLREKGEDWVIPRLAKYGGEFPLAAALADVTPCVAEPDLSAYVLIGVPAVRVDELIHFAMGIFWKSSVHPWSSKATEPWIDLGLYGEKIRRFLLDQLALPDDVVLTAAVLPPPVKLMTFHLPFETEGLQGRAFQLYMAGIQFMLWIGNDIPMEVRAANLSSKSNPTVLVTDLSELISQRFKEMYLQARKFKAPHGNPRIADT